MYVSSRLTDRDSINLHTLQVKQETHVLRADVNHIITSTDRFVLGAKQGFTQFTHGYMDLVANKRTSMKGKGEREPRWEEKPPPVPLPDPSWMPPSLPLLVSM